ncbi:MAG: hypothetical protein KatS3mg126_2068 [Lysobacteraceae bacterium]|nr:MAG: hypothetical protein KatS3mg126_2068 [Xanthomonadaceae bacterium]
MTGPDRRLPAEWEPQDGVLVAWPHAHTDWAARLAEVESTYAALGAAVTRFERLVVLVPDPALERRARALLLAAGAEAARLVFCQVDYDDTWLRDTGPITVIEDGVPVLLDFRFTGWGGKYGAERDDALVAGLVASGLIQPHCRHEVIDFALEGGAIDTDGEGTLLSTWTCLSQRHPEKPRAAIAGVLAERLGQHRVLLLEHGQIEGDDTDAHVDTLARFASPEDIVYQHCDAPEDAHFTPLSRMAEELAALRRRDGRHYRLHPLPWPSPILDEGRRLAASYANFLIIDGAVLVPAYDDPADRVAAQVLRAAFPGREVISIPCRPLIWQNGSLHCITMQLPRGVLKP